MKRFKTTINNFDKLEMADYEENFNYDSPYVVDDSNFVPMSEAVRQLSTGSLSQDIVNQYYDFPTGGDNGKPIPFSRTKECNDIAVLSSHIMQETSDLSDKISKSKAESEKRAAFEAELKSASEGININNSTPKE